MKSESFVYWLQGYFEIAQPTEIGPDETEMIKRHLNLVFKHEIDPSMGDEKHQQVLNEIHSPSGGKINFPSFNPDKELLRC
jgi:hypothetical protein